MVPVVENWRERVQNHVMVFVRLAIVTALHMAVACPLHSSWLPFWLWNPPLRLASALQARPLGTIPCDAGIVFRRPSSLRLGSTAVFLSCCPVIRISRSLSCQSSSCDSVELLYGEPVCCAQVPPLLHVLPSLAALSQRHDFLQNHDSFQHPSRSTILATSRLAAYKVFPLSLSRFHLSPMCCKRLLVSSDE